MNNFDVIVVGGGISGTMAAVASARNGVKTLLVEQYGFLGGMLTACGVGPMMSFHVGDKQVIRGFTGELIDRLVSKGKSPGHLVDTIGYTYTVTPFDVEGMKHELEEMVLESGGNILYHTMLAGICVQDGKIKSIQICNKSGVTELDAKVFIDATGDGDLSNMAGVECMKGRDSDGVCQPMTMKLRYVNVDIQKIRKYIKENPAQFPIYKGDTSIIDKGPRLSVGGFVNLWKEARDKGEITFNREDLLLFEGNTPGEVIINTTRLTGYDGTDPWSLSKAEIEGRNQALELDRFLKNKVPGFEKAQLVYTGPFIGVRSSRQIKGLYTLTQEDLIECRRFEDVIAHSGYPIDIHSPDGKKTEHKQLKQGDIYSIPYRCMINGMVENLVTVGRCVSATFEAQAAIRTTPTAGAIGHAGGAAASIIAQKGVGSHQVNIKELQNNLRNGNAYLQI